MPPLLQGLLLQGTKSLGPHTSQVIAGSLMGATWHRPCPTAITTWALITFSYLQAPKMLSPTYPAPSQGMVLPDS